MFLRQRGEYQAAFSMLVSRLDATSLSPRSYEHILTVELLAKLLKDLKQYVLAEYLLREVIEISAAVFGSKLYSFTLSQLSEISSLFWIRGQHRRAEVVSCYAYVELKEQLGSDHPIVFRAAKRYASYLRYQGRLTKANKVLRDILPRMQKKFGNEHPEVLWITCGIAAIHLLRGYVAEGRVLLKNMEKIMVRKENEREAKNPKDKSYHEHRDIRWIKQVLELSSNLIGSDRGSFVYFKRPEELPNNLVSFLMRPYQSVARPNLKDSNINGNPLDIAAEHILSNMNNMNNDIRLLAFLGIDFKIRSNLDVENINAIGGLFGTALHAAAYSGNEQLVEFLLAKGADSTKECGIFISPTKAATIQGHTSIVKMLLKNRKPLEDATPYITDLELAILVERESLVEEFLSVGGDPNYESILFGNALVQAVPTGNTNIVSSLLRKKVLVDVPSPFSLLPIVEVALAAGDAMTLDIKLESEYLLQLNSTVKMKQDGTLEVLDILIPEIEASGEKDNDETVNKIIDQALNLMAQPKTPPPHSLSIKELEELLKNTENRLPDQDHSPYIRRAASDPEASTLIVESHKGHKHNLSLPTKTNGPLQDLDG